MSTFHVIDGTVAQDVITSAPSEILKIVRDTYLQHSRGATVNPDSYFLRFPDNPGARIIALPAHLGGEAPVSGLKWIASYPENVRQNLPRASAVLLLNDAETGYPFACLEASRISAARTAASAALAVETLAPDEAPRTVLFVGAGIIGRTVSDFLAARGLNVRECLVHDHVEAYAEKFAAYASDTHGWQARAVSEIDDALATADLVVLATTAPAPWLADGQTLLPDQLILNLSLRDIHPTVMVKCHNIVDDIDHCLKAQTSPHLTETEYGTRDFIDGTLADVLRGRVTLDRDRPTVFSPFGLGVLDLAVGCHIYRTALDTGRTTEVRNFFPELTRW
ncbi:2,3-diaminopropionate biosynthesis protein SbnB [Streptomyces sp. NBC_01281]|uniref:2,3-diaminopropionate biosynthesis protein SbnB n=1 Tax=Streptomyces sp. NBC_01281 TaxID=2903811 RepID=UPI002E119D2F|nr:2,3-diaminopropionate biosynthesis protein SbnB [Streptomyces sp. NBC_01281]